jgi:hypothetical protein
MLIALFVGNLVAATMGVAFIRRVPRLGWLFIFMFLAVLECVVTGRASTTWEAKHVAAAWLFGSLLPWGATALYLFLTPYPRKAGLIACGVPIVYVLVLVAGLTYGDASGLIPQ